MIEMESVAEQNAVESMLYTELDSARYLRVPLWFVLSATARYSHHPIEFFERYWHEIPARVRVAEDYGPVVFGEEEVKRISFRTLAALFVSSAWLRPLLSDAPLHWFHPKRAIYLFELVHDVARSVTNDTRLFTDPEWVLSRHDHIYNQVPATDRTTFTKTIALHQARVELMDCVPIRLFPFSRDPASDAPRTVVIDPEIRFGRPTVKGAPTDVLSERWRAGDDPSELADDYGLTIAEVEESLRYEAVPYQSLGVFLFPPLGW